MIPITEISAEETKDSRGRPTLTVTVLAGTGSGTFAVPSGASTGSREALELRDADGHMSQALHHIQNSIRPALIGIDVQDQKHIDDILLQLDGTPNKSHLGGNTLIGVSIACAKAAASAAGIETFEHLRTLAHITPTQRVPFLYMNYINGGKHADSPLSFQEHIIVPQTDSVHAAMEAAERIDTALTERITEKYGADVAARIGDEGGHVLPETSPRVPFELLKEAIEDAHLDIPIRIATDIAASSFYADGTYHVGGIDYDSEKLANLYRELVSDFNLISIEDPFEEGAFADFAQLKNSVETRIVGDDLTVTNKELLARAITEKSISAIIIKPNQIGTLSETLETMQMAREHTIDCIVSHRSGETNDDFVADLAYAFGVFGLKAGALRRPERRIKYERLAHISNS